MKRLLRITFNSAIFSFIPILSWFMLGLLVDKNLVNVFTLTYPLQFIWALMKSIFATGANISKEKFNYRDHKINAYKLLGILLTTVFIMLVVSFRYYNLDLKITAIYLSFELINFVLYPVYSIKTCYLQLEKFEIKVTSNKLFAGILRMIMSLLKTPYCTGIGQVTSSIYQFLTINMMFHRNFRIDKNGMIIKNENDL